METINKTEASEKLITKGGVLNRLKEKWGLQNIIQVVAVLVVFSLAGSTVVWIRKFLFATIGFDETTPLWLKFVSYLFFIMPFYQILLLGYGFLLGQFSFFWEKEKNLLRRIVQLCRR